MRLSEIKNNLTPILTHPKYRADIDGLRAVAILAVIGFHAFPNWFKGGFIGVDVFFVISGFLISTILFENLERDTFSLTEFYKRRIKRIFPALLIVLISCLVFGWFALLADEYKQLGKHIAGGAGFISNFMFWREVGYFDNTSETKPLLHLWSLGLEEQFYIVWPLLLWVAWKKKFNLLTITVAIALVSFVLNLKGIRTDATATFYSPQTRLWEILCGSVLSWILLYKRNAFADVRNKLDCYLGKIIYRHAPEANGETLSNVISTFGSILIMYGIFRISKSSHFPGTWALLPTLGTVLIISAGAKSWINRVFLSSRVLVWFGLISFPLYLWHWPLLSFARIVEGGTPSMNITIAAVTTSIVLAWLTYRLIEKPIRFGKYDKSTTVLLIILMTSIGYAGHYIYKRDGLSSRNNMKFYEEQNNQIAFHQDLGRPAAAKIMLLGDSHAGHLVPGLKKEFGLDVADFTSNGCIPFYDVDRYDSRFTPGTCLKAMNDSLEYFEQNNSMTTIILSSMGPVYLTGEGFQGQSDERVIGLGVTLASNTKLKNRWEIYKYGMKNTLTRLQASQKQIIFVFDIPELGFEPSACIDSRPLKINHAKKFPCAVSRKDVEMRNLQYRNLISSVLKDFPKVHFYDPTNDFCDEQWCWAIKDKKILYRNIDHLSNEGSNYIIKFLAPIIRKALSSVKVPSH